jgi:hypothetical protein
MLARVMLTAFLFTASLPALAAEGDVPLPPDPGGAITVEKLVWACRHAGWVHLDEPGNLLMVQGGGYIRGVRSAAGAMGGRYRHARCVRTLAEFQICDTFVQWAERHRDEWEDSAAGPLIRSIREAHPCKD